MVDGDEEQKSYKPAFLTASAYASGYLPPVKIPDPPTEYEKMYPTNHLLILSTRNPFRKLCVAIAYSKVSFHSLVACKFNYRRCSINTRKTPVPEPFSYQVAGFSVQLYWKRYTGSCILPSY